MVVSDKNHAKDTSVKLNQNSKIGIISHQDELFLIHFLT